MIYSLESFRTAKEVDTIYRDIMHYDYPEGWEPEAVVVLSSGSLDINAWMWLGKHLSGVMHLDRLFGNNQTVIFFKRYQEAIEFQLSIS